jgi:hypothetical protein
MTHDLLSTEIADDFQSAAGKPALDDKVIWLSWNLQTAPDHTTVRPR